MSGTLPGPDGRERCSWCAGAPEFLPYHDTEWGFPVSDDRRLFEKLCLEGFQSGLSWRTILNKRENFRAAFGNFDVDTIAQFTEADVERLLQDKGIVRVGNTAQEFQALMASEFETYKKVIAEAGIKPE